MSTEATVSMIATSISAVGLVGVSISLLLQLRQTRVAQNQVLKSHQLELLRLAYEFPDLHEAWGGSVDAPFPEWRRRSYLNLIFQYLQMGYVIGNLTEADVERMLVNRFKSKEAREYWTSANRAFRLGARGFRSRKFYRIAQRTYQNSLQGLSVPDGPDPS